MDSEKSVQYFIFVEVLMEQIFGLVKRDLTLYVNIHFNDDTMKSIDDVVSFEISTYPYPSYDFTLFSGDYYRVPLSDIHFISISPIYDSNVVLDLSDPLYRYAKSDCKILDTPSLEVTF